VFESSTWRDDVSPGLGLGLPSEIEGRFIPCRKEGEVSRFNLTYLPEPPRAERHFTLISTDDHMTEPPDVFDGRVDARFRDLAPAIVELPNGNQVWAYEDSVFYDRGLGNTVGRPREEWFLDPLRYDEMRRGCWDVDARVADMDIDGVWASMCFPSVTWGFAGRVFCASKDQDLGLACLRAYNQWNIEAWSGAYPARFIPCQIAWLPDPAVASRDIYRNAELGFKAVSFAEGPHRLGLPSIRDRFWDPFFHACVDTGTVLCLHVGASGHVVQASPGASLNATSCLFSISAMVVALDWVWSGVPTRFPDLKIALSEGGIGWVPMAIDKLDHIFARVGGCVAAEPWLDELSPSEVLRRNFWFCMVDDPTALAVRDRIGIENIVTEVDYPHSDTTWPRTQAILDEDFSGMSHEEAELITWRNAAALFRHAVPEDVIVRPKISASAGA
jgi:predicted TIM-barrel fold metal-dependent hydrolase